MDALPYVDAGYGAVEKTRVNQLIEAEMAVLSKERAGQTLEQRYLGDRLPMPSVKLSSMVEAELIRLQKGTGSGVKIDMTR